MLRHVSPEVAVPLLYIIPGISEDSNLFRAHLTNLTVPPSTAVSEGLSVLEDWDCQQLPGGGTGKWSPGPLRLPSSLCAITPRQEDVPCVLPLFPRSVKEGCYHRPWN